jgi:ADP-sugar diphosphatase
MGSEEEKYAVLTVQPRIAAASLALAEIPAGMLDASGDFAGTAAKEIAEETTLKVNKEDLFNMSEASVSKASTDLWQKKSDGAKASAEKEMLQNAMYPSPGALDEFIPLFLCQKRLPKEDLDNLRGKLTGLREEGEKITLKLVPLDELWIEGGRDAKALAALTLYEGLRKMGNLPAIQETSVGA